MSIHVMNRNLAGTRTPKTIWWTLCFKLGRVCYLKLFLSLIHFFLSMFTTFCGSYLRKHNHVIGKTVFCPASCQGCNKYLRTSWVMFGLFISVGVECFYLGIPCNEGSTTRCNPNARGIWRHVLNGRCCNIFWWKQQRCVSLIKKEGSTGGLNEGKGKTVHIRKSN